MRSSCSVYHPAASAIGHHQGPAVARVRPHSRGAVASAALSDVDEVRSTRSGFAGTGGHRVNQVWQQTLFLICFFLSGKFLAKVSSGEGLFERPRTPLTDLELA